MYPENFQSSVILVESLENISSGDSMPIYEYKHTNGFSEPCSEERIELIQKMSEDSLKECPYCFRPIARMISIPAKHRQSDADKFSDSNLASKGFTKYVKNSDGNYDKVAGTSEAPDSLNRQAMKSHLDRIDNNS